MEINNLLIINKNWYTLWPKNFILLFTFESQIQLQVVFVTPSPNSNFTLQDQSVESSFHFQRITLQLIVFYWSKYFSGKSIHMLSPTHQNSNSYFIIDLHKCLSFLWVYFCFSDFLNRYRCIKVDLLNFLRLAK